MRRIFKAVCVCCSVYSTLQRLEFTYCSTYITFTLYKLHPLKRIYYSLYTAVYIATKVYVLQCDSYTPLCYSV